MNSEAKSQMQGCLTEFVWFASAFVGAILALLSSTIVIPTIFGIQSRSSASVWGLSGVADLVIGLFSLPVFFIAHLIAFSSDKLIITSMTRRAVLSLIFGIVIYCVVIVIVWTILGGGKVLRSH
jgi:hypothetical protein